MPEGSDLDVLSSGGKPIRAWGSTSRRIATSWRKPWTVVALALLVGAAVGAEGMNRAERRTPPIPSPPTLEVSLAPGAGGGAAYGNGLSVIAVPLAVRNLTARPLTVVSVQVAGSGAGLAADPEGRPSGELPVTLPPGQFVDVSFGLTSRCSVPLRPMPHLSLLVADSSRHLHIIPITIPDFENLWGATLMPGSCPPTD